MEPSANFQEISASADTGKLASSMPFVGKLRLIAFRVIACFIDWLVFVLPILFIHKKWGIPDLGIVAIVLSLLSFLVLLGVCEWKFGCTPGKFIFQLRVVDRAGRPPYLSLAIMRRCLLILDLLFSGLVGICFMLATANGQRAGDKITGLFVRSRVRRRQ